ncbi:Multidrug resistance protein stp [Vibrio aerogenes CECT 7868]|uniref:Multidrug resistance protein stp n=1 Tax=Vibrio aerogenes CECT 7868 TaxID=1216006 RepID=A0A1M5X2L7_9VIBR|nr:MFS transporter [Vibrio aerogenes]SHH94049.1 Multidrug resistance protein stp [Vibrio aerogenes CECT 7868]
MTAQNQSLSPFALLLLVAGQLLPQIDFSIVNVALDVMGSALQTHESGLVLIVALYALSFATLIATGARLGDRYGRKRIFMLGIIGFGITSAICGFATSITAMLAGRLLQGVFGALMMPQILATIHATLTGERHSRAVGIYTAVAGLSVAFGQMLGGWLVSANIAGLGWRLAFFINIPVCVLILAFGSMVIPETKADHQPHMDISGSALLALSLLCLLIPVAMGQHWPYLWLLLPGLFPAIYWLWKTETRKEAANAQPLLPPSLFKTPLLLIGLTGEIAVTLTYSGYIFITAFCLQSQIHFTPMQSGNTFIALGLSFFAGSLLSKPISQRLGHFINFNVGCVMTFAGFILTIGLFRLFGQNLQAYDFLLATALIGFGNALMITAAFRIALTHVTQRHAGETSSLIVTLQQGCFALGTAAVGAMYSATLSQGYQAAITSATGGLCVVLLLIGVYIFTRRPRQVTPVSPANATAMTD